MAKNYVNLDLPQGVHSNGTAYSKRGNWIDASRVRWFDNVVQPIGGWEMFSVASGALDPVVAMPATEVVRTLMVWRLNDGTAMFAAGSNKKLYAWGKATGTVHDITPLEFVERPFEVASSTGYGDWFYGFEAYGTERPFDEDKVGTFSWGLQLWGQNLLAAPRGAPSKLYEWDTSFSNRAVPVANSPVDFDCFAVTDQRIVMVAGSANDPRLVTWSGSEDNTVWTPAINNLAGFQRLPGIGRFMAIRPVQDAYLLVSETDVYVARYVGAPFVYGFDQVGSDCGANSALSVVTTENFVMWPGDNCFFYCDGSAVRRIECSVMDKIRKNSSSLYASKITGFVNTEWSEVWWLYQEGDDDLDSYVAYNWLKETWTCGKLRRTCGGGHSAMGGSIMIGRDGYAYTHELPDVVPLDADEDESSIFIKSGPIELAGGNRTQYIKSIQPDFIHGGSVDITLIGVDRPGGPETWFGPYTINYPATRRQPVAVRARGHAIGVLVQGRDGAWTMGSGRLDLQVGGEK